MFSLAVTGLALSSIYANIDELRRDAGHLTQAIAGLQTRYGRRRSFGSIEIDELLNEGTITLAPIMYVGWTKSYGSR